MAGMSDDTVPIKIAPEIDWSKVSAGPYIFKQDGEIAFGPLGSVRCGHCAFETKGWDFQTMESMFDSHNCEPAPPRVLTPTVEYTEWHVSGARFGRTVAMWLGITGLAYLLFAASGRLPFPWTN